MNDTHHCTCHHDEHEGHDACSCGHHHGDDCSCGCHHDDDAAQYEPQHEMFAMDDNVHEEALTLLQTEMEECDELAELLGVDEDADTADLLQETLDDLSPKKLKTLLNMALILRDYVVE